MFTLLRDHEEIKSTGTGNVVFDNVAISSRPAVFDLGDVNRDGMVDFFDISPFIELLSGPTFQLEADTNEDGLVDFFDIAPFIDLLSQ